MTFLIKKPIKVGEIITMKLQTAEEIIARLDKDDETTITVTRPLTLTYSAQGVGMTAWIMTAEEGAQITIDKSKIMTITPTMKQAADQYIQGTTGIKPVTRV